MEREQEQELKRRQDFFWKYVVRRYVRGIRWSGDNDKDYRDLFERWSKEYGY